MPVTPSSRRAASVGRPGAVEHDPLGPGAQGLEALDDLLAGVGILARHGKRDDARLAGAPRELDEAAQDRVRDRAAADDQQMPRRR